jgi:hypothetical protein
MEREQPAVKIAAATDRLNNAISLFLLAVHRSLETADSKLIWDKHRLAKVVPIIRTLPR